MNFDLVIKELENLNKSYNLFDLKGKHKNIWKTGKKIKLWSIDRPTAQILSMLVLLKKPKLVLELGTSAGYSTLWMAQALESNGVGEILTIELMPEKIELARDFFNRSGLNGVINQLEGNIDSVLNGWNLKKNIDFVFLDADKSKYFEHFKKIEPFLNESAIVVADNVINFREHMRDYLKYMESSHIYNTQVIEVGNGLMVSIKD